MMAKRPKVLINLDAALPGQLPVEVGSSLQVDVRSMDWLGVDSAADLLSEYDAILAYWTTPHQINQARLIQFREFLDRSETTRLVVFFDRLHAASNGSNLAHITHVIQRIQPTFFSDVLASHGGGSDYKLTENGVRSVFGDYLDQHPRDWKISVQLTEKTAIIPLALNASENAVAFTFSGFEQRIFFLPVLKNLSEFWPAFVALAYGGESLGEQLPDWVSTFTVPGLPPIKKKIDSIEKQIKVLENHRETAICEARNLESVRDTLLFGDGPVLEKMVIRVLRELGLSVQDGTPGVEDLTFSHGGTDFVVEVKGTVKSAKEEYANQLHSKQAQHESSKFVKSKGVLLCNAWRREPLENRDTADHPVFPAQMYKITNLWEIALVSTTQLLYAYYQKLEGTFDLDDFVKNIKGSNGVARNLCGDLSRFKVTAEFDAGGSQASTST